MNIVFATALGVCLGLILMILILWVTTLITQTVCGSRYFTPSEHIIKKKLMDRLKNNVNQQGIDL